MPVTYHDRLGKVRLCDNNSTHLLQKRHQNAVLFSWIESAPNITKGTVESCDVELIFQSHADTVQGSHELSIFFEMLVQLIGLLYCFFEKNFGKAASVSQISQTIIRLHVPVRLCSSVMWLGRQFEVGNNTRL